jgi:hypothetical protein
METNSFFLQSSFSLHFSRGNLVPGREYNKKNSDLKDKQSSASQGSIDIQGIYGYTSINKMQVIAAQNKDF